VGAIKDELYNLLFKPFSSYCVPLEFPVGGIPTRRRFFECAKTTLALGSLIFFLLPLLPPSLPSLSQIKEDKMFTKEKIGASSRSGKKAQGIIFELDGI
jgi:hypothetical protein